MNPLLRLLIWVCLTFLISLLIGLGCWQWQRYKNKKEVEISYETRQLLPSISIDQLKDAAKRDLLYLPVTVSGVIDNQHTFLLDNQVMSRKVGFRVFSPLRLLNGYCVLVDRGWVAGNPSRKSLPVIPSIHEQKVWKAILWRPAGQAFLLKKDQWSDTWPKVIQSLELQAMQKSLKCDLFPWIAVLDSQQLGVFVRKTPMLNMKASRHLGYAVQWWLMAVALVTLCAFLIWRGKHDN